MAEKKEYVVERHMLGDKEYQPGDKRELTEAEARPLLASGALSEPGAKAEKGAPQNKAEKGLQNKAGA